MQNSRGLVQNKSEVLAQLRNQELEIVFSEGGFCFRLGLRDDRKFGPGTTSATSHD